MLHDTGQYLVDFAKLSASDVLLWLQVSELANVMGLDVKRFSSKSATCEKLVDVVTTKYLTSANN